VERTEEKRIYLLVSFLKEFLSISVVSKTSPKAESSLSFCFADAWDFDWMFPSGEMSNEDRDHRVDDTQEQEQTQTEEDWMGRDQRLDEILKRSHLWQCASKGEAGEMGEGS
jgi:hypothetical protein